MRDYRVIFEKTDAGYSAFSPDIPGVGVAGGSKEEAERLLTEAIAFGGEPDPTCMVRGESVQRTRRRPY